jgi:transposase InsO family protein
VLNFLFVFALYLGAFLRQIEQKFRGCEKFVSVRRLRATEEKRAPKSGAADNIDLSDATKEKDMAQTSHAGGLYPNGDISSEKVYKFSNWVGSYTTSELIKMQKEDSDIGKILFWLSSSDIRPPRDKVAAESPATRSLWLQWSQLYLKDGILFRKFIQTDNVTSYDQLVLPSLLRNQVIKASHNAILSGHLGVKKTLAKIKMNFYWYKMSSSVKLWIKQCAFCGARKKPNKKAKAPLQEYYVGFPMDRVSTDILGPFPISESKNRYILVVMDNFTKYVECYAIPDQRAETVANKIVFEYFCRFGLPLDLHSDQGKNFQSELFRQMCCLLEINQTRCTPYRASSNGMVERFNQSLLNLITTYVNKEQTNWDLYLPIMTSAYRSSVHESTQYTPNMLMFGREFNLPVNFLVGHSCQSENFENYTDYVVGLNEKFSRIYSIVRENLSKSSQRQKRDYDTRISMNNYNVGDVVYCLDSSRIVGKSPKLKAEVWKGPFVITRKISDLLFEITGSSKSKPKIVHHDRLKKYQCTTIPQWVVGLQKQLTTTKTLKKNTTLFTPINNNKEVSPRRGERCRRHPDRLCYDNLK